MWNPFRREIRLETTYGNAKYIREPLLNIGKEYDVEVKSDRIAYIAKLTNREFTYLSDYIGNLAKFGVYPVLLREP